MFSSKNDGHLTSIGRIPHVLVLINVINEALLRRTVISQGESRNISPFNQQAGYPCARHSLELSQFLTFSLMTRRFSTFDRKREFMPKKKIPFYLQYYIHYLYIIIIILLL